MDHTLLHFNHKILWRLINLLFLTCIGLSGGGNILGITSLKPVHILTALATVAIVILISSMSLRSRFFSLTGITLALFGAGTAVGFQNCLSFLQSYAHWLIGSPIWNREQQTGYEIIQTIFLTLTCCLLQAFIEKNFRVKATVLLSLLVTLLYCLFAEKELTKLCVAFILCYAVIIYVEWTQIRWKKEKVKSIASYMLWVMPFLAIYLLLMLLPTAPKQPYDWQIVKNAYQHLKESFLKFSYNLPGGSRDDYDLSLSGFSEKSELGKNSLETDREIMTIQSKTKPKTNIYLSGKVYDTFNGREWIQQNEDDSKERFMDTLKTLYALRRYDKDYLSDYLSQIDITINYRYFRSEFLFAPLKTLTVRQNSSGLNFQESGGSLFFDSRKGYGTEYEVSFYQLNAGQEIFRQFLNNAKFLEADEDELQSILRVFENRTKESITVSDMQHYRQAVYDNYLEDVALSDGVKEYFQKITQDAQTDVDKLKAIERELSSFTYTRTPGPLPETVTNSAEFLDYFLLESKEGYCNYFATAFILLARSQGIPARFVQGFCVPTNGKSEMKVYSNMAHAWPEVYLEEVGWIPFEPTPGYSRARYASWGVKNRNPELSSGLNSQLPEPGAPEEKSRNISAQETEKLQESVIYPERINIGRFFQVLCLILLSISGFIILLFLANLMIARYKYRKMSVGARFKVEISRNIKILSFMEIRRRETETLSEFKEQALLSISETETLQFLDSYEDFLYGDKEIDQRTLEEVMQQQVNLLLLLKQKKKRTYFFYRILIQIS